MYSAAVRQRALSLVLDSHVSVPQAAREIGCSSSIIDHWLKKYCQPGPPLVEPSNTPTFIPVNITDSPTAPIEIVLPNKITIRLTDASPRYIAELLQLLVPC